MSGFTRQRKVLVFSLVKRRSLSCEGRSDFTAAPFEIGRCRALAKHVRVVRAVRAPRAPRPARAPVPAYRDRGAVLSAASMNRPLRLVPPTAPERSPPGPN
jgi:hypothetical protein